LFVTGGLRNSFLFSKGLDAPLIFEIPVPEEDPKWLHPRLYPVPATTQLTLDLSYDVRWVGKTILVTNLQGQTIMVVTITSKIQLIDISRLQPGIYFLAAKKGDRESIKQKFIKL
jgi:Secretion system C-terminal sorting domain